MFSSEQCAEGVVSIAEDTLRIFSTEQLDNMFNQTVIPLRYTPKKVSSRLSIESLCSFFVASSHSEMIMEPLTKFMIVLEGDDDTYPYEEKLQVLEGIKQAEANGATLWFFLS